MFNFTAAKASPSCILCCHQTHPFSSSLKSVPNSQNQPSFTVNYLVKSIGFSPEKALSASKYLKFEDPHKPDLVVEFFKNNGLTQTQISSLIRKFPRVLVCDTQKTLLPKLEFLKSKGYSSTDVAKIVCLCPRFLVSSLENTIIPSFDFLSKLLQSEEKAIVFIKRCFFGCHFGQHTRLNANFAVLREIGVSDANIRFLLTHGPGALMQSNDQFRQLVKEVGEMGFSPSKVSFVMAIKVLCRMTKSKWNKTFEVYQKWGLTEDEIFVAFRQHPCFMAKSEDKINGVMDFLVNEMGLESSSIARYPTFFSMSLEKRIVPRCAVYQALLSKGLIKTNQISVAKFLVISETAFVKKVLSYHEEEGPKLLNLFKEKLDLAK